MTGCILVYAYEGTQVPFTDDGWFNATVAAKKFGKEPYEWLRSPDTKRYIRTLAKRSKPEKSRFAQTYREGAPGKAGT